MWWLWVQHMLLFVHVSGEHISGKGTKKQAACGAVDRWRVDR